MYATRLVRLLVVALSAVSLAHALALDVHEWSEFAHDLVRRQSNSSPSSTPPSPTSSTPTPTPTPTSSPTSRAPTSTPPQTTPPTSTPPNSPSSSSTPPPSPSSSETKSDPQTTPPPSSSSSPSLIRSTSISTLTTQAPNGSPTTIVTEAVYTATGTLNTGNGSGGTSDITPAQRNIIIGTVVGIGGAIVFGVLGFVAWRIWGKKKAAEENDGLMGYGGDFNPEAKSETTGSTNTRTPFQSTLESYHAPTQVNTASNF